MVNSPSDLQQAEEGEAVLVRAEQRDLFGLGGELPANRAETRGGDAKKAAAPAVKK